jgi:hypothetical protein
MIFKEVELSVKITQKGADLSLISNHLITIEELKTPELIWKKQHLKS